MCTVVRLLTMVVVLSLLGACLPEADTSTQQLDVKVDTSSDLAWAQYEQNLRFAESYEARCTVTHATKRPRVLVTGFGRFKTNALNATGLVVSELLDGLDYPMTEPPPSGQVDPPGPQTAVAHGVIELGDRLVRREAGDRRDRLHAIAVLAVTLGVVAVVRASEGGAQRIVR